MTNAASRPKTWETTPPSAAPTNTMLAQVDCCRALAVINSPGCTRLGSAADDAGSKKALPTLSNRVPAKAIHTHSGERMKMKLSATTARAMSATIITFLRSKRSAM